MSSTGTSIVSRNAFLCPASTTVTGRYRTGPRWSANSLSISDAASSGVVARTAVDCLADDGPAFALRFGEVSPQLASDLTSVGGRLATDLPCSRAAADD